MRIFSYRVIIDDKTCVFDKENDPSLLRLVKKKKLKNSTYFIFADRLAQEN